MGESDCELCGEYDYLNEYTIDKMWRNFHVCKNCVEEGLRLRMKQINYGGKKI